MSICLSDKLKKVPKGLKVGAPNLTLSGTSEGDHFKVLELSLFVTLGGDKVSTLTHTYPHKPLRKIKVII